MFSRPSLHERMCWTWGSNSGPLACQGNTLPIQSTVPDRPPPSLISLLLCTQWVAKDPRFLHMDSEDSDQTGQMPRLWVFAGCTSFCWFCHAQAQISYYYMSQNMTKATKWPECPGVTQMILGIHPVSSVFAVDHNKVLIIRYPKSTQQRLWSDWVDAQADEFPLGAQVIFLWFCCAPTRSPVLLFQVLQYEFDEDVHCMTVSCQDQWSFMMTWRFQAQVRCLTWKCKKSCYVLNEILWPFK